MWRQTEFFETSIMPSYMISLTISDFKCISTQVDAKFSTNLTLKICGISSRVNNFHLALNISKYSIEFLESYFNSKIYLSNIGKIWSFT